MLRLQSKIGLKKKKKKKKKRDKKESGIDENYSMCH